ncbi:hypothetical protein ASZ90_003592 [hydrocarbon metagenome]|uniref:Uncharacterized protein n=1 Tax=hydrocarbon metagenome TaxID=938273 RepID=A0A0W8G226_9ZZZZ
MALQEDHKSGKIKAAQVFSSGFNKNLLNIITAIINAN